MKARVLAAVSATALLTAAGGSAQAATVLLYNTGVDASGSSLANGAAETHYTLVSSPATAVTALRAATSANGFPIPPWIGDDSASAWIGPNSDSSLDGPVGAYDYQVSFTLAGLNPATAAINGRWSSDNEGLDVLINGVSTGQSTTNQFAAFTPFSIASGFHSGVNTIDFLVNNDGGPTGLRVEMSGSANAVPEPAAWTLMLVGFTVMGASLRRVRRAVVAA